MTFPRIKHSNPSTPESSKEVKSPGEQRMDDLFAGITPAAPKPVAPSLPKENLSVKTSILDELFGDNFSKEIQVSEDLGGTPISAGRPEQIPENAEKIRERGLILQGYLKSWYDSDEHIKRPKLSRALFEGKTLIALLEDYEAYKIGHFPQDFTQRPSSEQLDSFLSMTRSIILEKIEENWLQLLSGGNHTLREAVEQFRLSSSVAQFSGALRSAHQRGITGKGISVGVLEPDSSSDHAHHVLGICKQLAPGAAMTSQPVDVLDAKIINASFGSETAEYPSPRLSILVQSGKLVINATGNDGQRLDLSRDDPSRNPDQNFYLDLTPEQRGRFILTGNLKAGNVRNENSTRPGSNPLINEHFLWTLGSDVLSNISETETRRKSGTSMSAPVVTGAAALVHQVLGPNAAPELVKECLMESADQDFWVYRPNEDPIHIIPPNKTVPEREGVILRQYQPEYWGKGILNIRRALEYAYLKHDFPFLSSKSLRAALDANDMERENEAAKKIQNFWRLSKKRDGLPET